ncbi:MAG: flavodoxin [Lachnospiraceae bacterium]
MKTLIAYFSHRGMNYAPGGMVELKVGNTERAAKAAAELTGAPLFEIRAERDYPFDYHECVEVSKRELKENARPALAELPEGLGELETLVLCYPCWCGTMPMPVWSFLEALGPGAPRIPPLMHQRGQRHGPERGRHPPPSAPARSWQRASPVRQRRRRGRAGDPGLARKKQAPLNAKRPPGYSGGPFFYPVRQSVT